MVQFPCKDCKDRHRFCHDSCEKYKAALLEKGKINSYIARSRRYPPSLRNYFNRRDKITKGNSEYNKYHKKGG